MNSIKFQRELIKRQVVSAQPGIYLGDLAKINLYLPGIKEQEKIANFLTAIDRKIEAVSRQIEECDRFKQGLLQKLFV
jgi:type I restriction enzyme S subunit